jgi:hypothetical protein
MILSQGKWRNGHRDFKLKFETASKISGVRLLALPYHGIDYRLMVFQSVDLQHLYIIQDEATPQIVCSLP